MANGAGNLLSDLSALAGLVGSAGNAMGIQGDNPAGLNALQRMAMTPEQQAALYQQKQSANTSLNDPNILQKALGNPALMESLVKLNPVRQTQLLQDTINNPIPAQTNSNPNQVPSSSTVASVNSQPKDKATTFVNNTLNLEGGIGGNSAFGIDKNANPDAYNQAVQLQKTKGDDAAKAYSADFLKKNYYDPNAQDLEALPPQQGQIAFDALVNHRGNFGQQVLGAAKAGATPQQLLAMRQQEYQRLAASDQGKPPEQQKYAPNLPGWNARLTKLGGMMPTLGQPSQGQGFSGMAGKLPQPTQPSSSNQTTSQSEVNPVTGQPYQDGEPHLSPQYVNLARKSNALTSVMGVNGDQARAAVQDKESEPSYVAWKSWNDNHQKALANMQEKQNDDNIAYAKDIHDDAQNARMLSDSLGEMAKLREYFTPGKLTDAKAAVAEWKIGLGVGTPEDQKLAASVEGEQKLAIQNVTGQLKQLTSRPAVMEFVRYLEANPNVTMSPQGFDTIIKYMKTQALLPLQKEQEFSQWKTPQQGKTAPTNYRDFDTQWDQKLMQSQSARMSVPPITTQAKQAAWVTAPKGMKYRPVQ